MKHNFNKNKPDRSGNTFLLQLFDKPSMTITKKIATNSRTTGTDEIQYLAFLKN
ncbi:MAG: hypothetical protein ABWZ79_13475 [Pedobacter agri]